MYKIQANAKHDICMYKTLKFKHMHVQGSQMIKGEQHKQQQQQKWQPQIDKNKDKNKII